MISTSTPYFFMSYSREDVDLQRRIIVELRGRGINDYSNYQPGWGPVEQVQNHVPQGFTLLQTV